MVRQSYIFGAVDVGLWDRHLGGIGLQRNLVAQGLDGMRVQNAECSLRGVEVNVIDERFRPDRKRQDDRVVTPFEGDSFEQLSYHGKYG